MATCLPNFIKIGKEFNEKLKKNGTDVKRKSTQIRRRDPLVKILRTGSKIFTDGSGQP